MAALVGGSSLGYGDADSVAAIHAIGLRRADGATLTGGSASRIMAGAARPESLCPLSMRVESKGPAKIIPSVEMLNVRAESPVTTASQG